MSSKKCLTTVTVSINGGGEHDEEDYWYSRLRRTHCAGGVAQTRSTHEEKATTTTEGITVTGTVIKMTTEEWSATKYQPVETLVVFQDRSNTPGSYVLNGPGHVVNKTAK